MSEIIKVEITDKRAVTLGTPVIVCGNAGYTIQFTFDKEWTGLTNKIARFVYVSNGLMQCEEVEFTGDTIDVPVLINTREVLVGVYTDTLCTSTPARVPCELSIRCLAAVPATIGGGETGLVGIANATINNKGELELTYSTGEKVNLGKVTGNNGKDGADGIGITNASINGNGELILTYTNGNTHNIGKVVGEDGEDVADGGSLVDSIVHLIGVNTGQSISFTLEPNKKYYSTIDKDCSFTLPTEIDITIDNTILLYANFGEGVSVEWGDVEFYGGNVPDIKPGHLDIVFAYNPTISRWCVGVVGECGTGGSTGSGKDGIDGKDGYTPVKGVDYWTDADKSEISADNILFISTELAKRNQLKPEFAQTVEGCTDKTKLYVLPEGYIYAYMTKNIYPTNQLINSVDTDGAPFNEGKGWKTGYYIDPSNGAETAGMGYEVTGFIDYRYTQTFRAKNITLEQAHGYNSIAFYDKNKSLIKIFTMNSSYNPMSQFVKADGTVEGCLADPLTSNINDAQKKAVAYFRIGCIHIDDDTIITVDEPLEVGLVTGWLNTGLAFIPADYEDRIIDLEEKVNKPSAVDSAASLNSNTCGIFRKVVCCGDSMTAGYINIGNGVQETNEDYSWPSFMARLTGNEYINCGASGATVLTWQTTSRGLPKAQSAGVAQAYLVGLGVNDSTKVELGTAEDIGTDNQTYYGGMSKIVRELNSISPRAKIFLQTMPTNSETRQAYNEAVRVIAETYKDIYPVHLLDLDAHKSLYFVPSITGDSIGGHYTAIAYQQFAENLRVIWSKYINSHISDFQDVYSLPCD